jgi:Mrp family chromosome partitioning ATPase
MTKMADLAGVAHNIAHHSASGLSFLSPHLAQALRADGEETTAIELLEQNPYPPKIAELQPLRLALASLKGTVQGMLKKHGFNQNDIISIVLHATPSPWDRAGYVLHTRAVITAKNGRVYDSGWL